MLLVTVHQTVHRVLRRRTANAPAPLASRAVPVLRRRVRPDGVSRLDHGILDHRAPVTGGVRRRRSSGRSRLRRRALEAPVATNLAALAIPGHSPDVRSASRRSGGPSPGHSGAGPAGAAWPGVPMPGAERREQIRLRLPLTSKARPQASSPDGEAEAAHLRNAQPPQATGVPSTRRRRWTGP